MPLKVLFLNCTLKRSPETSNTEAFMKNAEKMFYELDVETESVNTLKPKAISISLRIAPCT